MGWTFQEKPLNVKAELDGLLTWTSETGARRVLDSAIVNRTEYYAAVETIKPGGAREVWCAVFLLKFHPRARDGFTFGYKDMCETMGPYVWRCPVRILDLLTGTDNEYALRWREACREYHARRAALPKLKEGMRLRIVNESVPTVAGIPLREVTVLRAGTKPLFKVDGFGGYFRWPSWRQYNVEAV
jgi:hypothetical protein